MSRRQKFISPVDGLSRLALFRYASYKGEELKLLFYIKSGEKWQGIGDADGAQWSGYRTVDGRGYRYAQARIFVKKSVVNKRSRLVKREWKEVGLLDNIPTVIPEGCFPDYKPVMEVAMPVGEEPRIKLRYIPPVEHFSRELLVDPDPIAPGNQGDFGAAIIDKDGFEKRQSGIDISSRSGHTIVRAVAVGRVVLVTKEKGRRIYILQPESGTIEYGLPGSSRVMALGVPESENCVYVAHPDGYTVRYCNLDRLNVRIGHGVLCGTLIGSVSRERSGLGPEEPAWVHIEVRWGDPLNQADSVPMNPWEFFAPGRDFGKS